MPQSLLCFVFHLENRKGTISYCQGPSGSNFVWILVDRLLHLVPSEHLNIIVFHRTKADSSFLRTEHTPPTGLALGMVGKQTRPRNGFIVLTFYSRTLRKRPRCTQERDKMASRFRTNYDGTSLIPAFFRSPLQPLPHYVLRSSQGLLLFDSNKISGDSDYLPHYYHNTIIYVLFPF